MFRNLNLVTTEVHGDIAPKKYKSFKKMKWMIKYLLSQAQNNTATLKGAHIFMDDRNISTINMRPWFGHRMLHSSSPSFLLFLPLLLLLLLVLLLQQTFCCLIGCCCCTACCSAILSTCVKFSSLYYIVHWTAIN